MKNKIPKRKKNIQAQFYIPSQMVEISLNNLGVELRGELAQVWTLIDDERSITQIADDLNISVIKALSAIKHLEDINVIEVCDE